MTLTLRPARPDDAQAAGRICYDAFEAIGKQHGYPGSFPSDEVAAQVVGGVIAHPGFYDIVAELLLARATFCRKGGPLATTSP